MMDPNTQHSNQGDPMRYGMPPRPDYTLPRPGAGTALLVATLVVAALVALFAIFAGGGEAPTGAVAQSAIEATEVPEATAPAVPANPAPAQ